jgi:hypothetical protein
MALTLLPGRLSIRDTGASKQRRDQLDCALSQHVGVLQLRLESALLMLA